MDRKYFNSAIQRFQAGERPFSFREPTWHLITNDGALVPLKYVYAMALGIDSIDTHTDKAKSAATAAGFVVVARGEAGQLRQTQYWWVNHKQTYKAELEGGYIWSPKENQNGARNQTYINLTLVRPGDVVISYAGAEIRAIGVAIGAHKEKPKPKAFGQKGQNWSTIGWFVPVEWTAASKAVLPKAHLASIVDLLPECSGQLIPDTSIGGFDAIARSYTVGGRYPSFECSRSLL